MSPDRDWLTSAEIAGRLTDALLAHSLLDPENEEAARLVLRLAYKATGYDTEFKILRLTEKIKTGLEEGRFQDLDGVRAAFQDIYRMDVLEQFDEEGNYIED